MSSMLVALLVPICLATLVFTFSKISFTFHVNPSVFVIPRIFGSQ